MTSIPAALRMLLQGRDLLDREPDFIVAETVEQIVEVLVDAGIAIEELLDDPTIAEQLGGVDYLRQIMAWREDSLAWSRSRRPRKGPAPEPPKAPTS
jgi:hypothetical protein